MLPDLRPRLGVIGGLGPMASADFYRKIVELTPARDDAEHLPLVLLSLPQIPDRSGAILAETDAPLPALRQAVETLDGLGVEAIAIVCNTAHHWYDELTGSARSTLLHIADCAIAELAVHRVVGPVMILATRGTLQSGFYQRKLAAAGYSVCTAFDIGAQAAVDTVIARVKAGDLVGARTVMSEVVEAAAAAGIKAGLLACTELPLAAEGLASPDMVLIDPTAELARACLRRFGIAV
jgi:aspartate racemase